MSASINQADGSINLYYNFKTKELTQNRKCMKHLYCTISSQRSKCFRICQIVKWSK